MEKEELNSTEQTTDRINGIIVGAIVIVALVGFILLLRRRKNSCCE